MTAPKDEISSVEECIAWNKEQLDIAERLFLAGQPELKSTIDHLHRLQQMRAELEACRRDAERYRWLREPQEHLSVNVEDENVDGYTRCFYTLIRNELDSYIDSAIRAVEDSGDET